MAFDRSLFSDGTGTFRSTKPTTVGIGRRYVPPEASFGVQVLLDHDCMGPGSC